MKSNTCKCRLSHENNKTQSAENTYPFSLGSAHAAYRDIRHMMVRGHPQPKHIGTITITGMESVWMLSSEAAGSVWGNLPDP